MIHMLYIKLSQRSGESLTKPRGFWVGFRVKSATFIKEVGFLHYNMVSGKHKSNSMRKVFRRTPGAKNVMVFKKRKPSKAICAQCGKQLAGVARARPRKMQNMPKTAKRPTRPYGGKLCAPCTRKEIIKKARK